MRPGVFPIALDKAAQGMGLEGKRPECQGTEVPGLWAKGEFQKVLDYVAQDVRMALQIAQAGDANEKCIG